MLDLATNEESNFAFWNGFSLSASCELYQVIIICKPYNTGHCCSSCSCCCHRCCRGSIAENKKKEIFIGGESPLHCAEVIIHLQGVSECELRLCWGESDGCVIGRLWWRWRRQREDSKTLAFECSKMKETAFNKILTHKIRRGKFRGRRWRIYVHRRRCSEWRREEWCCSWGAKKESE